MIAPTSPQMVARLVAGLVLVGLGTLILRSFIVPLLWAVILTIATYPMYLRLQDWLGERNHSGWAPLAMTLILATVLLAPVAYGLVLLGLEAKSLGPYFMAAQHTGLPAPEWIARLPLVGSWFANLWGQTLGTRDAVQETLRQLGHGSAVEISRQLAAQVVHRLIGLTLSLLAVLFLDKQAEELGQAALRVLTKWFGNEGVTYAEHALDAVRATVNGLVLVGLGQAFLFAATYFTVGIPHPVLSGTVTGLSSMVPFVAPLILTGAVLFLFMNAAGVKAILVAIVGVIVLSVADHFVRPVLIGGAGKLPFLWVLLGILGGVETFGLLGLFVGPTVMAVLVSLWRDLSRQASTSA